MCAAAVAGLILLDQGRKFRHYAGLHANAILQKASNLLCVKGRSGWNTADDQYVCDRLILVFQFVVAYTMICT